MTTLPCEAPSLSDLELGRSADVAVEQRIAGLDDSPGFHYVGEFLAYLADAAAGELDGARALAEDRRERRGGPGRVPGERPRPDLVEHPRQFLPGDVGVVPCPR